MRTRAVLAALAAVLVLLLGAVAYAGVGGSTLTLGAGDSLGVDCSGPSLTWTESSATSGDLVCAPQATTEPTPDPSPEPDPDPDPTPAEYPNATNTGVPDGVTLTDYTGTCTITTVTTIDAKRITKCDVLVIKGDTTISRSEFVGHVDADFGSSITFTDSDLDGGTWRGPVVGYSNVTVLRSNIVGAEAAVLCSDNCHVEDSWLHDPHIADGVDVHANAYISNGGSGHVIRHNTLNCNAPNNSAGGSCSSNLSLFGDFANMANVLVENNLIKASPGAGYCTHAGGDDGKPYTADHDIVYRDNVFERGTTGKCAFWGAATSFDASGPGNQWVNNVFDDGSPVNP